MQQFEHIRFTRWCGDINYVR